MSNMPQQMQKLGYQSVEVVIFRVICNSTKKLNDNFAVENVSTSLNLGSGLNKSGPLYVVDVWEKVRANTLTCQAR
jgi:hypothetical protein